MTTEKVVESGKVEYTYTYDEAVELAGHGKYNRVVLLACCVISNAVALDMFGFALVVATCKCDLQLSVSQIGTLASMPFVGVCFAFPWGYYADTRGRRRALLLSCFIGFAIAALGSLAPNWQTLMVMKVIGCSFSTASHSLTMAYLGESIDNKHRSEYMSLMNSANLFSEPIAYFLALGVLSLSFNIPIPWLGISFRPWRLLAFLMALALGIGATILCFLYESPKFLANSGDNKKALEVLKKIFEANEGKSAEYRVKALKHLDIIQNKLSLYKSFQQQTTPIFKPPLLCRTLQLSFLMLVCCAINNIFVMWYPLIVNAFFTPLSNKEVDHANFCHNFVGYLNATTSKKESAVCKDTLESKTIYTGIFTGFFFTILNLCVSKLAAWRRLVLITLLLVPAISETLLNVVGNPIISLVLFVLVQITAVGIGVVASYCVDLYPTSYRGAVTSFAMMIARLGSFSGINIIGQVVTNHCGLTFSCFAVLLFGGVVVAFFLPSDNKGQVPTAGGQPPLVEALKKEEDKKMNNN